MVCNECPAFFSFFPFSPVQNSVSGRMVRLISSPLLLSLQCASKSAMLVSFSFFFSSPGPFRTLALSDGKAFSNSPPFSPPFSLSSLRLRFCTGDQFQKLPPSSPPPPFFSFPPLTELRPGYLIYALSPSLYPFFCGSMGTVRFIRPTVPPLPCFFL